MRSTFLVLLCLPLASVAAAKDFRFAYSPAELAAPDALYAKLDRSVARHCHAINDGRSLRALQLCERTLMEMAVEQIDHPEFAAYLETSREGGKT